MSEYKWSKRIPRIIPGLLVPSQEHSRGYSEHSKHTGCKFVPQSVIQPIVLPFKNSIPEGVFQQNDAHPHTSVVIQRALQSVDMLPWLARSPDLSPIEHI
ncbi:uncharacterized protein TNCV_1814181 [Trichonephila clavipes]|nr:uncharacterized protein TNCV_1814181 [Trichonephila clavipes]